MEGHISVLHVDDDPQFVELASAVLQREDGEFAVRTATSAEEAMAAIRDQPPDCIVSDYDMPGMDGLELLAAVREEYPDLPFIMFTGKGTEQVAGDALSAGATDYLQKRGGTEQYSLLANRIRTVVQQYHNVRERDTARRYRQQLYRIASDTQPALDTTVERLLELGCERLGVENGHVTEVDRQTDRREVTATGGSELVEPGTVSTVTGTYCQRTISEERILTVSDAVEEGWAGEPAHEQWEVGCYIGGRIEVGGDLHGTVCFVDRQPRAEPFTERERTFVNLLTRWLSHLFEQREREREFKRHRQVLESLPVGVLRTTFDGEILEANGALMDIYGMESRGQLRDIGVRELYRDDSDRDRLLDKLQQTGQVENELLEVETLDGEPRFVRTTLTMTVEDGTRYLDGVVQDVTDRRELERELDQSRTIAESLNDPVYVVDENGRFTYVNDEFVRLVGYPEERILGSTPRLIKDGSAVARAERQLGRLLSSEGPDNVTFEVTIRPRDGEPVRCEDHMGVLPYEGGRFEGSVGVLRDITDRKHREQALRRERNRLDEFASVVSHDLRSPLSVARGNLDLLAQECDSDRIEQIDRAHGRMSRLIDDLLTLARQGEMVSDTEPVALGELAETCWRTVEGTEASLVVETDRTIECDPSRLRQLLENLYRNAIEHAGPSVVVTVGETDDGFYVEDDGPGIPAAERETVFESGYSTAEDGTGFGLRIAKQITEAHGWTVRATAGESGGARFEVTGVSGP